MTGPSKADGRIIGVDIEVYPDLLLICAKDNRGEAFTWQASGSDDYLGGTDCDAIRDLLSDNWTCGYNSVMYDIPIITYALQAATCHDVYMMSKDIIENKIAPWTALKDRGVKQIDYRFHVDLMGLVPGRMSLKEIAGRLHCTLEDLPYDPNKRVDAEQIEVLRGYCYNDVDITLALFDVLKKDIRLRKTLQDSSEFDFGWNTRRILSMSAPKIGETVFSAAVPPGKATMPYEVNYEKPPVWSDQMDDWYPETSKVINAFTGVWQLDSKGSVLGFENITGLVSCLNLRCEPLAFGHGGLHSEEEPGILRQPTGGELVEIDASSYYPHLFSAPGSLTHCAESPFLDMYKVIMKRRLIAKSEGDITTDAVFKLLLNSAYGKTGSRFSRIFNPELRLAVCLSGQVFLVLLIEMLARTGICKIHSANTDGILAEFSKDDRDMIELLCQEWTEFTGIPLTFSYLKTRWRRDVNSYFQETEDGKIKTKGAFNVNPRLQGAQKLAHNPNFDICFHAAIEYFVKATPIEDTLRSNICNKHLWTRCAKAKDGCVFRSAGGKETDLGRVARWYIGGAEPGTIHTPTARDKVKGLPDATHCTPVMKFPTMDLDTLPDINMEFYRSRTQTIIDAINGSAYRTDSLSLFG